MRAARFVGLHQPPALEELPAPELLGPDDVIVKIAGAGVCRTDLHILDGQAPLQPPPAPPFTLGHENAGWIDQVGPGVDAMKKGDPVILHPAISCGRCLACRRGADMYCSRTIFPGVDGTDGGYAEYLRTSARAVVPLPPGTDPTLLAPLADAGITAYHAVRRLLPHLGAGTVVAVIGVGGLGHLGIQLIRTMSPARVLAIDRADDRLELARRFGAEWAVSSSSDVLTTVLQATHGEGADVVLDFVAESTTPELALKMLRRGGTYSIVGYGGVMTVPTVAMIAREITVQGNFVGTYTDLVELMELARQGRVAVTSTRFPLARAADALAALRAGAVQGRAVLVPG